MSRKSPKNSGGTNKNDVYTRRHLTMIRRRKKVKNCHAIPTSGPSYHIEDKPERVKKVERLLTTE